MGVVPGNRVTFVRGGKVLEGLVFAVREGACSVEGPGNRAYYLERWEILLVAGFDEDYARWLAEPLDASAADRPLAGARTRGRRATFRSCRR